MKVKVETDMMHDNMEMDLVCSASHIQKIKMEYEETGIANTTEGIKFLIGKKDTNQSGRMGGNLCSKKDVKVRVGAKDGIDTVRVNRALISKKSQGTGVSISVSFEHKCRLRRLLKKLLSLREWKGAAGVLGTLLKGTCKDRLSLKNRRKYWASLELLGRIGVSSSSLWKLERIYEIWMSKQPWGSRTLRKKKYLIQLEVALLLLMEAKLEDACNITKFLVQEPESRNEPFVHMVHGLILYQLWYASIPEELQLTHVRHQAAAPSSADLLYVPYNDSKPVEALDPGNAVDNLKEWASGYNSENSIGNFKGACNGTHDKSSKNKQFRGSCPLKLYMDGVADMSKVEDSLNTDDSFAADFSFSYACW